MRSGKQTTRCAGDRCTSCRTGWQNRMADRCKCRQMQADADEFAARQPECRTGRYPAARTDSCADMATDSQIDCQITRYAGKMTARCSSSSADIPDNGRYAFRQATDTHPAEQAGRTEWQNRMAGQNGRQMRADADECTARLPDC